MNTNNDGAQKGGADVACSAWLGAVRFWKWDLWTHRKQLRKYRLLESRLEGMQTLDELDTPTLKSLLNDIEALQAENDALRKWSSTTQAVVKEVTRRMDEGSWT